MKILIVAATQMEVRLLADEFNFVKKKNNLINSYNYKQVEIDILISGIGTTFTTFHLTNTLANDEYTFVLNVGIAGSFTSDIKIGDVVNVCSEEFADLGIESNNEFQTLFDTGYIDKNEFPFENGIIKNSVTNLNSGLKNVKGITLNKSNGRKSSIDDLVAKFDAQIESMEGAAVFYVCKQIGIPFLEIRAISNNIEPRDFSKWDIPLALENLNSSVLSILTENIVEIV